MLTPTDEELLREYVAGRAAGFELLVRRHGSSVYQFAQRFTHNGAASEDVVQETFLQVSLSASKFEEGRKFRPWLYTIAANKARDWLRGRQRKHEVSLDAGIGAEPDAHKRFVELLHVEAADPSEELEHHDNRRAVRSIVEEMPRGLWEVLVLAYYHHFRYREIGEILGIPLGTVKSRLHAAIAYFGERYREVHQTRPNAARRIDDLDENH